MKGFEMIKRIVLTMFVLLILVSANSTRAKGNTLQEPQDPSVYLVNARVGLITGQTPVLIDGVDEPIELIEINGKNLLMGNYLMADGQHYLDAGSTHIDFTTENLSPGQQYTHEGVTVLANNEGWGRVGIVNYKVGNYIFLQISGWGYYSSFPDNVEWWDFETLSWEKESNWDYYTIVRFLKYKTFLPIVIVTK